MLGNLLAGLLILAIGIHDAYVFYYKKNPYISDNYPRMKRYVFPMVWILLGIGLIVSGFFV